MSVQANKTLVLPNSPLEGKTVGSIEHGLSTMNRRRIAFLALNLATIAALSIFMAHLLSVGGWNLTKLAMMAAYVTTLPWLSIGFWNAVIGFILLTRASATESSEADPMALSHDPAAPLTARTAIVMALRNEDPEAAIARLRSIFADIEASGQIDHFDFHILSDTNDCAVGLAEESLVAQWRRETAAAGQILYRRRTENLGYKAGNIEEFCRRAIDDYEFFLPLDADSVMSAATIIRLVRTMEANPHVGILQTLVVGSPAKTLFARAFQFGMRHGMRSYTCGSTWWQGDCGPYWGHNALVRMRPFRQHCMLPVLPGRGPLSGHIMSHDQIEAVLMRKAGYHVRVLTDECESWEENPPTLPDFVRRELRWCQGNMQYWRLLAMPGLQPTSRLQLLLAILMFVGSLGWMSFILFGLLEILTTGYLDEYPVRQGLLLFGLVMTMNLMPKIMGLANVLASSRQSARYGGRAKVLVSGILEFFFSILLAPAVSFAIAVFMLGLIIGRRLDWQAQERTNREVEWREATARFLPQTLLGIGILALLYVFAPLVLIWALPVIAGLVISIPFAVWTAAGSCGEWSVRNGLFQIPEETLPHRLLHHSAETKRTTAKVA